MMKEFPTEVFDLIVSAVTRSSDLKNIRLAAKVLSKPATRELFSKVCVTLPGLPGSDCEDEEDEDEAAEDDDDSASHFNAILASPMSKEVRSIQITTSLEPNKDIDDYHNNEKASILTDKMKDLIELVNRFPNLTNMAVEFSCVCACIPANDWYIIPPEESVAFRTNVLQTLLAALNDPDRPAPNLKSLSFKNLQNFNADSVVKSTNFLQLLGRVSELRLKIVTQHEEASPESNWSYPEMYNFFTELPSIWLEPASQNLTSLTLHMDDYWGYVPKADFRSLNFPKLKKLELGNYTFSHDWQLDWILSHQTLEELILDDCPIVRRMRNFGPVDWEGYLVTPKNPSGVTTVRRYDGRWAEYFRRIEGMLRLRRLRFGVGEWSDGSNFDGGEWVQIGMHGNMYMQFNRGVGPTPWQYWTGRDDEVEEDEEEDNEDDDEIDIAESSSASFEAEEMADAAAYDSLMAVLAKR